MTTATDPSRPTLAHNPEKAITLALSLAQAERAIQAFTAGQLDAVVDCDGKTYLLRPAQESLRQSERRLREIIDRAADVITVVNRSGTILSQSRAVLSVLGYEPEELVGSSIFELVYGEDLDRLYTAFFNVIEGIEESRMALFYHRMRNGSFRLIEATVSRLSGDTPASAVFILRPVASPRPLPAEPPPHETVSKDASHAKDRFLAMLSHELRTPLTPILLGVQDLQEDERFIGARPTLAMIRRNVEVQSRLLEELADFTSVGEHKVRLRLEALDVHEAIRFVLEICRSELSAARIKAHLFLGTSPRIVVADSVRLQQVMWNLVKNGIKFSEAGSSIAIATTDSPPGHLKIEFADHGIGIEPALLPLIFDAFQQGSVAEQRARGGLGLGLFIAKGLTEAQGGTLTAQSEGRGKGAKFLVTLPLAPSDESIPATQIQARLFDPASAHFPKPRP